ncbi:MAG: polysaccharide pyruvyl transferase family protein [Nitrosomonas sp.]|nr:polysaccharide pyruvyl transferase family protein [Nitrosomonas sp.]
MAHKYYFLGHETFSNRGCEALIRGVSGIIRERSPESEFLVPSFKIESDRKQWNGCTNAGIRFIPAYQMPLRLRIWGRFDKMVPGFRSFWLPTPHIPSNIRRYVRDTTAGIMTGGDVLSLDYGIPSLLKFIGQAESYMARGHRVFLWAASIGPFGADPEIERFVIKHLNGYANISVRESSSRDYLEKLGFKNVKLVADPAFVLMPESWDISTVLPTISGEGLLGFNISPLIKSFRNNESQVSELETAIVEFLCDVIKRTELSIVLIPHVDSIDGGDRNSDYRYMQRLIDQLGLLYPETISTRIVLAPRDMNAVRTKYLISRCRFFIGARTHATIAAWSTCVPTISIAYSVKATGLNTDLFGDLRYVLETQNLSKMTLWESLEKLRTEEQGIGSLLKQRIPECQRRARLAGLEIG